MKEERSGPWLFSVNIYDPHGPFDPPQEYVDRFDIDALPGPRFRESDLAAQKRFNDINFKGRAGDTRNREGKERQAKYWAQIELIDDNVGRMLDVLEETGQRENTIVIFTSDHGDMTGDHGLVAKGCRFYDPLVGVPLIFSWPGRFKAGLRSEALVELTDIVPTLLEVNGLSIPNRIQGRSLLAILEGRAEPHEHRDFVRSVFYRVTEGPPSYITAMIRENYLIWKRTHTSLTTFGKILPMPMCVLN
jgi:arylsulfatase A-like enzyme